LRSLSIFHDPKVWPRFLLGACVGLMASGFSPVRTSALNPAKGLSQYVHERWGVERGFVGGEVNAICQSGDGYLWIGTERGLVRFDGTSFQFLQQPIAGEPAIGPVRQLVADGEGSVWVRLDGTRLLRYREGHFEDVVRGFNLPLMVFTAMSSDDSGGVFLVQLGNVTFRYENGRIERVRGTENIPGTVVTIARTRDHTLWLGTSDDGLYCMQHGSISSIPDHATERNINMILPANNGGLWIGTGHGLDIWDGKTILHDPSLSSSQKLQILSITMDEQGDLWLGTNQGLARMGMDGNASRELLSEKPGSQVTTSFIDREGGLWFGGPRGVERWRDAAFSAFTTTWGLPTNSNGPICVDGLGRVWVAPLTGGLFWFRDREQRTLKVDGLDRDIVYSITADAGRIWLGRQHGGLTVLEEKNGALTSRTYHQAEGLSQDSVFSVFVASDHAVWAGTVSGGISRFKDGAFTTWKAADGLSSETINAIAEDRDGVIWAATPNGLDAFRTGRWTAYSTREGLPSPDIRTLYEDAEGVLWIATSEGLAYLKDGKFYWPRRVAGALREPIAGMAQDAKGSLWLVTSDHVVEVGREKLLSDSLSEFDVRDYGIDDGLPGVEGVSRYRTVVSDHAQRIWLSLDRGLAMTDGKVTSQDASPAAVRIDSVMADRTPMPHGGPLSIAPGTRTVTFIYGVAGLVNRNRVRYRYKLDGFDKNWSDITDLRQVTYTNLAPRDYRFQVIASNAAGLWNNPISIVVFTMRPAFWQTWWFRLLAPATALLVLFGFYRLRMYRLVRTMNQRFQERLSERTRIAQELHDTLLQGVLSAAMQLDVVEDQLPEDSPVKPRLQRVLQLISRVTEEGRTALRGLRAGGDANVSLEQSFSQIKDELALRDDAKFRVVSLSVPRSVSPIIRDEVYRIGREALTNAFHHAQARSVEVEIEYASNYLRLLVRDDGRGIDSKVLTSGRDGHFGLIGMRERSEKIGGRLHLRSRIDAGTEVELIIPGAIAFAGQASATRSSRPSGPARSVKPGKE
jgi:signal transduction histidine kinase/ligand-binding sensor domain-containing protein